MILQVQNGFSSFIHALLYSKEKLELWLLLFGYLLSFCMVCVLSFHIDCFHIQPRLFTLKKIFPFVFLYFYSSFVHLRS